MTVFIVNGEKQPLCIKELCYGKCQGIIAKPILINGIACLECRNQTCPWTDKEVAIEGAEIDGQPVMLRKLGWKP